MTLKNPDRGGRGFYTNLNLLIILIVGAVFTG